VCPHIALFGSAPSYEHLRVFGCVCYPNTAATAPHKLAPRSTQCVFLGYSSDHKGYHCLDLSTNSLIVSRHVVFDEDSFPLAASPNPTDLDFLCESGSTISTVGTRLTTAGTVAPCQPAPEVPPGFEPLVAPLPAPVVPPGFLPRAASTAASRAPRLLLLHHARPRPLLLHRLWSRTAHHPVSGRPRRSPTSVVRGSPPPRVPLHHPLFGHLLQEVRVWWCLSRLQRILTGWSHGRRMASECYLIDSSSPPRLRLRHHPRSHPSSALPSPIPIGAQLWRMSTGP
jgi:hypothetical protein